LIAAAICGARLFGPRAGVAAAASLALVAPFLYYGKAANVDLPYVFWWAASMVVYLRLLETFSLRDFVLFAMLATFAVCTKDQAYGLYLLMPIPLVYRQWQRNRREGAPAALSRAIFHPGMMAAAATVVVLFAVIHNLAFNLAGFRDHVAFMIGPGSENYRAFDKTLAGHAGVLRLTAHLVQEAFGWPLFVAGMAGFAISLLRPDWRRGAVWLLVPIVSYYLGFIDVILYNYDRFVLPICVVIAIFAGFAIDRLLAAAIPVRVRILGVAALGAYSLLYASTVDYLMIRDSRYTVECWLAAHVGPDELVGYTFSLEYLPRLDAYVHADIGSVEDLTHDRPSFYVLNADYGRAVPSDHPTSRLIAGLRDGTLGYHLVLRAREESPFPWLPGAHEDLVGAREGPSVFVILRNVNPTIEVFGLADDRRIPASFTGKRE
jgi:hypothetical protein